MSRWISGNAASAHFVVGAGRSFPTLLATAPGHSRNHVIPNEPSSHTHEFMNPAIWLIVITGALYLGGLLGVIALARWQRKTTGARRS